MAASLTKTQMMLLRRMDNHTRLFVYQGKRPEAWKQACGCREKVNLRTVRSLIHKGLLKWSERFNSFKKRNELVLSEKAVELLRNLRGGDT